jgi:hypothetical protein
MALIDDHEPASYRTTHQIVLPTGRRRQLRERRMHRTAVIALRIVLKKQLPVRPYVVLGGLAHRQIRKIEAVEAADQ